MKIIFIFSCSGMFRNVPECSMFRILSTPFFVLNRVSVDEQCSSHYLSDSTDEVKLVQELKIIFYRCVIYGDLLEISQWRNLLPSILGLFQTPCYCIAELLTCN